MVVGFLDGPGFARLADFGFLDLVAFDIDVQIGAGIALHSGLGAEVTAASASFAVPIFHVKRVMLSAISLGATGWHVTMRTSFHLLMWNRNSGCQTVEQF